MELKRCGLDSYTLRFENFSLGGWDKTRRSVLISETQRFGCRIRIGCLRLALLRKNRWGNAHSLEHSGWSEFWIMDEEVAKMLGELKFTEDEMMEMNEAMDATNDHKGESEKWIVAKKKPGPQGNRKAAIVYIKTGMGGTENSSNKDLSKLQVGQDSQYGIQGDKGRQKGSTSNLRIRNTKRGLQGKYEVCTPVGSNKAKSVSCAVDIEEEEGSPEVASPLKINTTVEAGRQPRREP
ncbi:hypothetical protein V6N13_040417 [Hibiscus sabdariffa]